MKKKLGNIFLQEIGNTEEREHESFSSAVHALKSRLQVFYSYEFFRVN